MGSEYANKVSALPDFETGSDVEIARELVDLLHFEYGQAVHSEGAFHAWTGTHWDVVPDALLRRLVHPLNGAQIIYGRKGERLKLTKTRIDGALHEAAAMMETPGFFSASARGINCTSGLLQFNAGTSPVIEPHDPVHRFRHCLQSSFDPSLSWFPPAGSLLAKLLEGCFAGDGDAEDKVTLFAEIAGAVILGIACRLSAPKCIVLLGETAENGKSQFLDALKGLVPQEAVSSITPQQMGHEQYRALLAGKLLNVSDELGMAAIQSDAFKAIITGEAVTAKAVYRPPFSFRPVAQHVFATNRLPPFSDGMDRGVRRRLLPLVFDRTIPMDARIPDIGKRIASEEAHLLLAFAIHGAQRILEQGTFTIPVSSRQALARWSLSSDPVMAFLQDDEVVTITGDYGDQVTSKRAYSVFRSWTRGEGIPAVQVPPHGQFTARVKEAGLAGISIRRRGKTGTHFHGVRIGPTVTRN